MRFSLVNLATYRRFMNFRTLCLSRGGADHDVFTHIILSRKFISSDVKSSNSSSSSESSSDDSSSSDEEDNKKPQYTSSRDVTRNQSINTESHKKLNTLLQSMVKQQETKELKNVDGPKAEKFVTDRIEITKDSQKHSISKEISDIEVAAKTVAESLGGDIRKTESELLNRLISHGLEKGSSHSKKKTVNLSELIAGMQIDRKPSTPKEAYQNIQRIIGENPQASPRKDSPRRRGKFEGESISSSENLADAVPRKDREFPSKRDQSSDMGFTLRRGQGADLGAEESSISASLFSEVKPTTQSRSHRVSSSPQTRMPPPNVDIFGGEPLGIFSPSTEYTKTTTLSTWQNLCKRELRLALTHPPSNYFEEMIHWTEKEMIWKFPINNEQGLEEEAAVLFTDHVFLEKHLSPWCPTKGPIRHFMELVCVGLSKNPYYTVEEKKNHILWFKQYFEEKKDVLKTVGISLNFQEQPKLSE